MSSVPQVGHVVSVRGRIAVINSVNSARGWHGDERDTRLHVVGVEYLDGWSFPAGDELIWELESDRVVHSEALFPLILESLPDSFADFTAFCMGIRWSSLSQYFPTERVGNDNFVRLFSPWKSAIRVEDYQLSPVLQALDMQRVRLLLADGVGLGKTIQAGLIMTELMYQRKIRRILIICPASLQDQWKDEMYSKFNLRFTIVNASQVARIEKEKGIGTNVWGALPRIITSQDYLKQREVQNRFELSAKRSSDQVRRVWDLLIVDEAHNFSPGVSEESQRTRMLRNISKWFEHRLFLTATPHNGYTWAFSGLLELLDPMRFSKTPVVNEEMKRTMDEVVIRRLKSDLVGDGGVSRFSKRELREWEISLSSYEENLISLLVRYRDILCAGVSEANRFVHIFVFTILMKRLLSSRYAFAKTWWHHISSLSLEDEEITYQDARSAIRQAEDEDLLDEIRESRENSALEMSTQVIPKDDAVEEIRGEIARILGQSGLSRVAVGKDIEKLDCSMDAKTKYLIHWLKESVLHESDERVIIFTEYRDTQSYVLWKLKKELKLGDSELRILHGLTDSNMRNQLKHEFNDERSGLKILLATDTASEGLNLQYACRYLVHYDIPWNPSKLEQRNGRIDRHGQARDVTIFHFTSRNNSHLALLGVVARKVGQIQDDLGEIGDVLAKTVSDSFLTASTESSFSSQQKLIEGIEDGDSFDVVDSGEENGEADVQGEMIVLANETYERMREELGITPKRIADLFEIIYKRGQSSSSQYLNRKSDTQLEILGYPAGWEKLIENTVRDSTKGSSEPLPFLVFSEEDSESSYYGREIFRPQDHLCFITLGHPVMGRVFNVIKKDLWSSEGIYTGNKQISKWIISKEEELTSSIISVHVLVNLRNKLAEIAHSEYLVYEFDTSLSIEDMIESVTIHRRPQDVRKLDSENVTRKMEPVERCRHLWIKYKDAIDKKLKADEKVIREDVMSQLATIKSEKLAEENARYESARKEFESRKSGDLLQARIREAREERKQRTLSDLIDRRKLEYLQELSKAEEIVNTKRNREYLDLLLDILDKDHQLAIKHTIPNRFEIKESKIDVHPIAVAFHIPSDQ